MAVSLREGKGVVTRSSRPAHLHDNALTDYSLHIPDFAGKMGVLAMSTLHARSTCAVVAALEGPNVYTDNPRVFAARPPKC